MRSESANRLYLHVIPSIVDCDCSVIWFKTEEYAFHAGAISWILHCNECSTFRLAFHKLAYLKRFSTTGLNIRPNGTSEWFSDFLSVLGPHTAPIKTVQFTNTISRKNKELYCSSSALGLSPYNANSESKREVWVTRQSDIHWHYLGLFQPWTCEAWWRLSRVTEYK